MRAFIATAAAVFFACCAFAGADARASSAGSTDDVTDAFLKVRTALEQRDVNTVVEHADLEALLGSAGKMASAMATASAGGQGSLFGQVLGSVVGGAVGFLVPRDVTAARRAIANGALASEWGPFTIARGQASLGRVSANGNHGTAELLAQCGDRTARAVLLFEKRAERWVVVGVSEDSLRDVAQTCAGR